MRKDRSVPGVIRAKERDNMNDKEMRVITNKADELARQYNKTKDPVLKDQWYKLLKQVPQEPLDYPSSRT
jgi:hypothetical protein